MAYGIVKTEHAGAKRGRGAWMRKREAKRESNKARRAADRRAASVG